MTFEFTLEQGHAAGIAAIDDIAFRANILALNAALEATSAVEAGKVNAGREVGEGKPDRD